MPDERPINVRTFKSTVDDRCLEDFLNRVDVVGIYSIVRSTIVHREGVENPDHAEAIVFGERWPSVSGGREGDQVQIYGSRVKVVYRERPAPDKASYESNK